MLVKHKITPTIEKRWDKVSKYTLEKPLQVVKPREDLQVGETLKVTERVEGEGNKYITRPYKIIDETPHLYICTNGKYKTCFRKNDHRYGLLEARK